ncbi:hypothetical protein TWF106_008279, partial [Orbilia oligospora]
STTQEEDDEKIVTQPSDINYFPTKEQYHWIWQNPPPGRHLWYERHLNGELYQYYLQKGEHKRRLVRSDPEPRNPKVHLRVTQQQTIVDIAKEQPTPTLDLEKAYEQHPVSPLSDWDNDEYFSSSLKRKIPIKIDNTGPDCNNRDHIWADEVDEEKNVWYIKCFDCEEPLPKGQVRCLGCLEGTTTWVECYNRRRGGKDNRCLDCYHTFTAGCAGYNLARDHKWSKCTYYRDALHYANSDLYGQLFADHWETYHMAIDSDCEMVTYEKDDYAIVGPSKYSERLPCHLCKHRAAEYTMYGDSLFTCQECLDDWYLYTGHATLLEIQYQDPYIIPKCQLCPEKPHFQTYIQFLVHSDKCAEDKRPNFLHDLIQYNGKINTFRGHVIIHGFRESDEQACHLCKETAENILYGHLYLCRNHTYIWLERTGFPHVIQITDMPEKQKYDCAFCEGTQETWEEYLDHHQYTHQRQLCSAYSPFSRHDGISPISFKSTSQSDDPDYLQDLQKYDNSSQEDASQFTPYINGFQKNRKGQPCKFCPEKPSLVFYDNLYLCQEHGKKWIQQTGNPHALDILRRKSTITTGYSCPWCSDGLCKTWQQFKDASSMNLHLLKDLLHPLKSTPNGKMPQMNFTRI